MKIVENGKQKAGKTENPTNTEKLVHRAKQLGEKNL